MKSLILYVLATNFLSLTFFLFPVSAQTSSVIKHSVKGMHCGSCAKAIEKQVCALPEVKNCKVSVGEISYEVKEGQNVSSEKIQELLTKAGKYTLEKK
jgi:copper chaperone CopZ